MGLRCVLCCVLRWALRCVLLAREVAGVPGTSIGSASNLGEFPSRHFGSVRAHAVGADQGQMMEQNSHNTEANTLILARAALARDQLASQQHGLAAPTVALLALSCGCCDRRRAAVSCDAVCWRCSYLPQAAPRRSGRLHAIPEAPSSPSGTAGRGCAGHGPRARRCNSASVCGGHGRE